MAESNAPFDATDPTQIAVRFEQLQSNITTMQLAFTNTAQNLSNVMQGLQAEVRDVGKTLSAISQLEHDRQSHGEGLARAFEAIAKLSAMHEQAWERHAAQEQAYRERAEAEHQRTQRILFRWGGASTAASALVLVIVSLVVFIYRQDQANFARDFDNMDVEQRNHAVAADLRMDKIEGVLIEHCAERNKPCQFR